MSVAGNPSDDESSVKKSIAPTTFCGDSGVENKYSTGSATFPAVSTTGGPANTSFGLSSGSVGVNSHLVLPVELMEAYSPDSAPDCRITPPSGVAASAWGHVMSVGPVQVH